MCVISLTLHMCHQSAMMNSSQKQVLANKLIRKNELMNNYLSNEGERNE